MMKAVKIVLNLMIAVAFLAGGQVSAGSTKKATFIIGMDAPMTGDVGFVGEGMKNAMLLAKEKLGETKYNYDFVFEDDKLDAKMSATAAQKLINVDKVDAIVTIGVGGPIVNPLATKYNIIHFAIELDPTVAKGDNNFIHFTPTSILVGRLVKEMQNKGIRKVAVFRQTNLVAWNTYMEFLRAALKDTDIK
ncbi:MAG: ABC transporter substrate-binding protein, partial [Nitrospirota bacterium]